MTVREVIPHHTQRLRLYAMGRQLVIRYNSRNFPDIHKVDG